VSGPYTCTVMMMIVIVVIIIVIIIIIIVIIIIIIIIIIITVFCRQAEGAKSPVKAQQAKRPEPVSSPLR
jgi:flagellar basal body-associated protein FliL